MQAEGTPSARPGGKEAALPGQKGLFVVEGGVGAGLVASGTRSPAAHGSGEPSVNTAAPRHPTGRPLAWPLQTRGADPCGVIFSFCYTALKASEML